jgi:DNA-binding beta-propeller fold protein YncE
MDKTKGDRWFEVVDARTLKVLKRIDMGKKLAEFGMPNMSSAVRPMALSPDEHFVYFQISFFHGFVEYDLRKDRVTRVAHLPLSEEAAKLTREQYLLDSAHHGLAINPKGTKLCAAGTMSDYAAIVSRRTFSAKIIPVGKTPYWATNSADGRYCFLSISGDDRVAVVSYKKEELVTRIAVGDHPQRMRMGKVRLGLLRQYPPVARASR